MDIPDSSRIVLNGQTGCIGLFEQHAEITQEGEGATLSYKMGMEFQHDLPIAEFRQLWETILACDPLTLQDTYGSPGLGLGGFCGTLNLEWQDSGQTFQKIIDLGNTRFINDARIQKLHGALETFMDEHCRIENERAKE